jgi:hypothetical protein
MVGGAAALTVSGAGEPPGSRAQTPESVPEVIVSLESDRSETSAFDPADFGIVGVFDVDWLSHPDFTLLLDNMAASPRAFRGVRFFGAFTAGTPDDFLPESGGVVWTDPDGEIDFTPTFVARPHPVRLPRVLSSRCVRFADHPSGRLGLLETARQDVLRGAGERPPLR